MKLTQIILFVIVSCSFSQWSSDPGVNLMITPATDEAFTPKTALGTSGDVYVSWAVAQGTGSDMRLQRLDLLGNPMWGTNGILVREDFTFEQVLQYDLTADISGAAILAFSVWSDSGFVVYAYRISTDGDMLWGADGILLSDTSSQTSIATFSQAAPTSSGDVVLAWSLISVPDSACTVMQRITPGGDLLWGEGIVLEPDSASIYCWEASLCPTGTDEAMLVYTHSDAQGWNKRLYAMRYDDSGNPAWPDPAVISENETVTQQCIQPPPHPDGSGGFLITWEETLASGIVTSIVQHVTYDGALIMNAGGTPVSTTPNMNHTTPFLSVMEGEEESRIFWLETDELQSQYGLYGQRMDSSGNRQWTNNGIAFIELQVQGIYQISTRSSGNESAVFYTEGTSSGNDIAKCMLIDSTGGYVWSSENIEISNAPCARTHFATTPLCWGQQWIAVWEDSRRANQSVFAQNIKLDGTLGAEGLGVETGRAPDLFLTAVSPNPFSAQISATFTLNSSGIITTGLYDASGRLVSRKTEKFYSPGSHTTEIPTENLPCGVYILRLAADGKTSSRACVLLR